jgi:hypothetical protein
MTSTTFNRTADGSRRTIRRNKRLTGVALDPEVVRYLDDLAVRMRLNRSWVINCIVNEYAKFVEHRDLRIDIRSETLVQEVIQL